MPNPDKIPVCYNINEIKSFLAEHQNAKSCLYLAYKTEAEWNESTSRIYNKGDYKCKKISIPN